VFRFAKCNVHGVKVFVGFTCWFESTPGRVAAVCS